MLKIEEGEEGSLSHEHKEEIQVIFHKYMDKHNYFYYYYYYYYYYFFLHGTTALERVLTDL